MKGLYLVKIEKAEKIEKLKKILKKMEIVGTESCVFEQYHDNGEEEHAYNVYLVTNADEKYVLKKSSKEEIFVYEEYLEQKKFQVPHLLGKASDEKGKDWILLEYLEGKDLREHSVEKAVFAAKTIAVIHREYWQLDLKPDANMERYERYIARIEKRAQCLEQEEELKETYRLFLERQKSCPKTICNGDYLPYNALFDERQKKVAVIDWAFGGMMPYALDVARMIVHGNENRYPFPFYMTDEIRKAYIGTYYDEMKDLLDGAGITREQYLYDIKLAALNECIEFIEQQLKDSSLERDGVFDFYYQAANEIVKRLK